MAADPARLVGHNAKKDGAHAFFYAHLSLESHVWYVMTANGAVLRTLPPMPCCMWFLQLDDAVALLPYLRCYYAAMTLSRSFAVGLVQARSGPEQALFCRLSSWCSFLWRLTLQDLLGTMLKRMVRMLSSMHIWAWSHIYIYIYRYRFFFQTLATTNPSSETVASCFFPWGKFTPKTQVSYCQHGWSEWCESRLADSHLFRLEPTGRMAVFPLAVLFFFNMDSIFVSVCIMILQEIFLRHSYRLVFILAKVNWRNMAWWRSIQEPKQLLSLSI